MSFLFIRKKSITWKSLKVYKLYYPQKKPLHSLTKFKATTTTKKKDTEERFEKKKNKRREKERKNYWEKLMKRLSGVFFQQLKKEMLMDL